MLAEFEKTTFAVKSKRLCNVFLFAFVVTNALRKGQEGVVKLVGRKNLFSHASFVINALRELKTFEKPSLTLNNRALFHYLCCFFTERSKEKSRNWSLMILECAGRV